MRRNTHHPSSGGTFLIHTPLPDAVHLRIEAKGPDPPMRGLKRLRCAQVICSGHAFVQNLRRGHYELGHEIEPGRRLEAIFTELALAL